MRWHALAAPMAIAQVLLGLGAMPIKAQTTTPKPTFAIFLTETGDTVLTDADIASYDWDRHRLELTEAGMRHWESFYRIDDGFDPPIPKLGPLTKRQFALAIDGQEMYRGRFWSAVLSSLPQGVSLYDVLGVHLGTHRGELRLAYDMPDSGSATDPRARAEVRAYFRARGKLKSEGQEPRSP